MNTGNILLATLNFGTTKDAVCSCTTDCDKLNRLFDLDMHPALFLMIAGIGLLIVVKAIDVYVLRKKSFDDETMPCPHCGEPIPKLCLECLNCRKPVNIK